MERKNTFLIPLCLTILLAVSCSGKIDTEALFKQRNVKEDTRFANIEGLLYYDLGNEGKNMELSASDALVDLLSYEVHANNITLNQRIPSGQTSVLTADHTKLNTQTQIIELHDNVSYDNGKDMQLKTDQLTFDNRTSKAYSDSEFVLIGNQMQLKGTGFIANRDLSDIQIKKAQGIKGVDDEI